MAHRYTTLDAMRGLAALIVVLFHFDLALAPAGYLAVDFFFMLSGFVLWPAHVKGQIRGNEAAFLKKRAIRLYPLYAAGLMLGLAAGVLMIIPGAQGTMSRSDLVTAFMASVVMMPMPTAVFLYPINGVFWTIAVEAVLNVVMALVLVRMSRLSLCLLAIVLGCALCVLIHRSGSADSGGRWELWDLALLRGAFSFTMGILLQPIVSRAKPFPQIVGVLAIITLQVALSYPAADRSVQDMFLIVVLFPALLALAARADLQGQAARVGEFLGDISYALYAIHLPLLAAIRMVPAFAEAPVWIMLPGFLVLATGLSWVMARYWDLPIRRYASGRPRAQPQQGVAICSPAA